MRSMLGAEAASFLCDVALKSAILLLAARLVAWTIDVRRATARERHCWWIAVTFGVLLIPFISGIVPEWRLASWPEWMTSSANGSASMNAVEIIGANSSGVIDDIPAQQASGGSLVGFGSFARVLCAVWLVGVVLTMIPWIIGYIRLEIHAISSPQLDNGLWHGSLTSCAAKVGLNRLPRLLVGDWTPTPLTWGVFAPVVVIPRSGMDWSSARRRVVLLHELIHIRQYDWFTRLLGRVMCAIHWFNPFAWLALRSLTIESELACDENVLLRHTTKSSYAGHLLAIAKTVRQWRRRAGRSVYVLLLDTPLSLERRVKCILSNEARRRKGLVLAPLLFSLVFLTGALAGIRPQFDHAITPGMQEQPELPLVATGRQALIDGQWHQAIDVLNQAADLNPENGEAWFLLGLGYHHIGAFDEALVADSRSAAIPSRWQRWAYYNRACTHAVMGQTDAAFGDLEQAVIRGVDNVRLLRTDVDLESLREDSRFCVLLKVIAATPSARSPHAMYMAN